MKTLFYPTASFAVFPTDRYQSLPSEVGSTAPQFGAGYSGTMEHPQALTLTVDVPAVPTGLASDPTPERACPREDPADPA